MAVKNWHKKRRQGRRTFQFYCFLSPDHLGDNRMRCTWYTFAWADLSGIPALTLKRGFSVSGLLIFLVPSFFVVGGCPVHHRIFAVFLASTHQMPVATPPPPKLQQPKMSPDIVEGPRGKNHCPKRIVIQQFNIGNQQGSLTLPWQLRLGAWIETIKKWVPV